MEAIKTYKKAIFISMVSAAASLIVTTVGKKLLSMASDRKRLAAQDKKLNKALEDTMDCSDPVAKY